MTRYDGRDHQGGRMGLEGAELNGLSRDDEKPGRELDLVSGSDRITAADVPGLARVVAVSSFRIGMWATATGISAGRRVVDVAMHPGHAGDLAEDLQVAAAAITRALVGKDVEERLRHLGNAATHNAVIRVVAETVENVSPIQPAPPVEEPEPVMVTLGG